MNAIDIVEAADQRKHPRLNPGDTVKVHVRVEGPRSPRRRPSA